MKNSRLHNYLNKDTEAAPLAVFRIIFGTMMLLGIIRFWAKGWIDTLYIQPGFFFSYYGFEWVKPLGIYTYALFFVCGLSCLFIALGYKYRIAAITFFFSFTYIELMDKTTYLNHYYFVSLVGFLLIFLPAADHYSLDAKNKKTTRRVPQLTVDALKLMMAIVYFYAGLAKLNSDWLFNAQPLRLWLAPKYDLPLIGPLLKLEFTAYFFSWFGAIYDLAIPFLLLYRKTRLIAFAAVIAFHVLTWLLFPIGMFPFIMIGCALIFFSPKWHRKLLEKGATLLYIKLPNAWAKTETTAKKRIPAKFVIIAVFFTIQLLFPFRYMLYPGELFWTEEGFRFSWRVMLMEKAGYAQFTVKDRSTGHSFYIDNSEFLTPFQEKQMAFQPDFILEYAHFLHEHFEAQGVVDPIVTVESRVSLNGRPSATFIDPNVDLAKVEESFMPKKWINNFNDEIKGL